jgi:glycine oxidase
VTVIVIGAGVVGCAVAYELASRGAGVRVLEWRGIATGATRASAGILAPTIEGHVPALLELGVSSLDLYDEFVERACRAAGRQIEYERSGTLQVALNNDEADDLCALSRTFNAAGVAHTLMDDRQARVFDDALSPETVRALFVPQHGYVSVSQLTHALADAAVHRGATVTPARVLAIEDGDQPAVRTEAGTIAADAIVVATGSWTDQIVGAPDVGPAVKPIRGQLIQLRADPRPAKCVIWGRQCYAVPWRDGTVLVGATVEDVGFDERATMAGVHGLLSEALHLLPVLRGAAFEEVRVGLRPMTKDELPAIGASSTMRNVFYATGHYRNGVLLAPLTAKLVADLVLDGRKSPELELMRPARLGL